MVKEVIWSERAINDRDEILTYWIRRNKSTRYSIKLNQLFNKEIDSIKKHPKLFINTNLKNIRVRIIREYLILFEELNDVIRIYAVWDGRRNPRSLKKHLRNPK